jgi:hypothetical protein
MFNFAKGASLLALVALLFSSCGVDQSKPETVALAFMQAVSQMDFDGAKKYCDEKTGQLMGMASMGKEKMIKDMTPDKKKEMDEAKKNLKSATCKVDGDKATCTVCCNAEGKASDDAPLTLVKKDGKWLVAIDKENKEKGGRGEEPAVVETPAVETPAVDSTAVDTTGTN